MNPRLTPKDRALIKGALRRAFSRSELRKKVLDAYAIEHFDDSRPRVKHWCYCAICGEVVPRYTVAVDHIDPVIPTNTSFEEMSLDTTVDRLWCVENNLQVCCDPCHTIKTSIEKEERKLNGTRKKR